MVPLFQLTKHHLDRAMFWPIDFTDGSYGSRLYEDTISGNIKGPSPLPSSRN